jgi:E3 ubiquitin-protein ligase MARCH6
MYTKITVALTFMGPDWWLKLAIEQLYQDGLRNINLSHVLKVRGLHCKDTIP